MIEMIGNFDPGQDALDGAQRENALKVIALVLKRFDLPPTALRFHSQLSPNKTCPGKRLDYDAILQAAEEVMQSS